MIIVTCIFVEYQTGAIADDSFDDIHMTLGENCHFLKQNFSTVVEMHFQSSSLWLSRFRTYDTRCLYFRETPNWSNCTSLF